MRLIKGAIAAFAIIVGLGSSGHAQEKTDISITRQPESFTWPAMSWRRRSLSKNTRQKMA